MRSCGGTTSVAFDASVVVAAAVIVAIVVVVITSVFEVVPSYEFGMLLDQRKDGVAHPAADLDDRHLIAATTIIIVTAIIVIPISTPFGVVNNRSPPSHSDEPV